jgi:hypothetical protein
MTNDCPGKSLCPSAKRSYFPPRISQPLAGGEVIETFEC